MGRRGVVRPDVDPRLIEAAFSAALVGRPITIELLAKIAAYEHNLRILPEDSLALIKKPIVIEEYSNGQGSSRRSSKAQPL
jgi:hypothetical protein